jgi:hypothetical protein
MHEKEKIWDLLEKSPTAIAIHESHMDFFWTLLALLIIP